MNRRAFLKTTTTATATVATVPALILGESLAIAGLALGILIIVVVIVAVTAIVILVNCLRNAKPRELPPEDPGYLPPDAVGYLLRDGRLHVTEEACPSSALPGTATGTVEVLFAEDGTASVTRFPGTLDAVETPAVLRRLGLNPDAESASYRGQPIPVGQSTINITSAPGQPACVEIMGASLRHVAVQTSRDLEHWTTVFTALLPPGLLLKFCDTDGGGHKFYRMVNLA